MKAIVLLCLRLSPIPDIVSQARRISRANVAGAGERNTSSVNDRLLKNSGIAGFCHHGHDSHEVVDMLVIAVCQLWNDDVEVCCHCSADIAKSKMKAMEPGWPSYLFHHEGFIINLFCYQVMKNILTV